jgi:hypothetical protein
MFKEYINHEKIIIVTTYSIDSVEPIQTFMYSPIYVYLNEKSHPNVFL